MSGDVSARKKNHRGYSLSGKPALLGRVGLMLKAVDVRRAPGRATPYSIVLNVDGKQYFKSQFDRIQNKFGWHIRSTATLDDAEAEGEFRKLFREEEISFRCTNP